ncbi:related to glyoxal oxidase precursor [Serendipita indica DSM 11827]|uniref:Related to glyoxal oxidase n=1 Tax=Serendipita indica (strain DSM 11827) TaxID=1109443 RepID=G4T5Z0_SERID|nr:related to glyoxal oxidase precursor [Serendipita indica DSM 11827]
MPVVKITMVYTIIPIITLVLGLLSSANASWRFNARTLVTARVDPLISPNSVSSHVHDYAGASNFGVTYDYDNMRSSSCTSSSISVDHSGYWMPSVYYKNRNGSFRLLKSSYIIYYLHRGTNIKAFPAGFRMIAGTATKDSYTQGNAADEAVNFHCLGPNTETPFFPDQACPQGVRVQILFPSCWNGKDITSSNFKDHVAYPVDGKEGNTCPSTHPVRLITLFLEHIIYMDDVDWYPGSLVFSEGDNHGRSSHADFTMGWDSGFLQSAIDQCTDPTANNMCGLLSQHLDSKSADACQPAKYLPLEDVGFYGPISKLLGDNPVWGNGITKATTGSSNTPPLVAPWSVVSSGWQEFGCIDEGDPYTNTMNGDKVVDQSMSPQMCVSHCNGKGFSLAGLGSGKRFGMEYVHYAHNHWKATHVSVQTNWITTAISQWWTWQSVWTDAAAPTTNGVVAAVICEYGKRLERYPPPPTIHIHQQERGWTGSTPPMDRLFP